jgi:hypothetical protein
LNELKSVMKRLKKIDRKTAFVCALMLSPICGIMLWNALNKKVIIDEPES